MDSGYKATKLSWSSAAIWWLALRTGKPTSPGLLSPFSLQKELCNPVLTSLQCSVVLCPKLSSLRIRHWLTYRHDLFPVCFSPLAPAPLSERKALLFPILLSLFFSAFCFGTGGDYLKRPQSQLIRDSDGFVLMKGKCIRFEAKHNFKKQNNVVSLGRAALPHRCSGVLLRKPESPSLSTFFGLNRSLLEN